MGRGGVCRGGFLSSYRPKLCTLRIIFCGIILLVLLMMFVIEEYSERGASMDPMIRAKLLEFRDARDWKQYHNPKDLAMSISIEAAELLEIFQWSGHDPVADGKLDLLKDELADVLIYCELLADALGVDTDRIVQEKMERNENRFPIE